MSRYQISVKVDQIVTKEVRLEVEASSPEEAEAKTKEALQTYPDKVMVEGINRMVTVKSHYWIPRDIDVVKVVQLKEEPLPPKGAA